jgi:hypothetical protein
MRDRFVDSSIRRFVGSSVRRFVGFDPVRLDEPH